ncbi:hypothetical protein [Flavihumibacter profundi]|jgi:hypothetical protein|nr:hypothetical protein [Flavihumibacter profundi]
MLIKFVIKAAYAGKQAWYEKPMTVKENGCRGIIDTLHSRNMAD